jgi:MerR family transcriptional regulator, copper efflux regulator
MIGLTVGAAASRSGWSARMLRYLEAQGLVVPERSASGYRLYGLAQLNRLRGLSELRTSLGVGIAEIVFAARLRREPELRRELDAWLAAGDDAGSWIDWEQHKHERLLAA